MSQFVSLTSLTSRMTCWKDCYKTYMFNSPSTLCTIPFCENPAEALHLCRDRYLHPALAHLNDCRRQLLQKGLIDGACCLCCMHSYHQTLVIPIKFPQHFPHASISRSEINTSNHLQLFETSEWKSKTQNTQKRLINGSFFICVNSFFPFHIFFSCFQQ